MGKVYFVRHQAAGYLYDLPFSEEPTAEQVEACTKRCFRVHGFGHSKTPDVAYWVRVEAFDLLDADAVVSVPDPVLSVASAAGTGEFVASGEGTVSA